MITKNKLRNHLKERYEKSGKEISFLSKQIAKEMGVSSYAITHAMLKLESDGIVERYSKPNIVRWRTCFGEKNDGKRTN